MFTELKHIVCSCLVLCLLASAAHAQYASKFDYITTEEGLPSNYVFGVAEDRDGYLWAATDKGLGYFTGASWEVFDTDDGFPGNYISRLFSDKKDGLWLGIAEHGWFHFDIVTKKLQAILIPKHTSWLNVFTDNDGNLVYITNSDDAVAPAYKLNVHIFNANDLSGYKHILKSKGNMLFIRNEQGSITIDPLQNNPTDIVSPVGWKINKVKLAKNTADFSVQQYSNGFLTTQGSIYYFDESNNYHFVFARKYVQGINDTYTSIASVANGIYFSNQKDGFCFYNKNGQVTAYDASDGLTSSVISHIHISKNGLVMLSSLGGGINILRKQNHQLFKTGTNSPVRSIVSNNNKIQFLSGGWLHQLKGKMVEKEMFIDNTAMCIYFSKDSLLAGTLRGVNWYKNISGRYALTDTSIITAGISSIFFDDGYKFGTYDVGLLPLLKPKRIHAFYRIKDYPLSIIEKVVSLKNGYALLSYEKGFVLHNSIKNNDRLFTQKDGLLSNAVYHVEEKKDSIWVSTKHGITVFVNEKAVKQLSINEGFKGNRAVYSFHDNVGQLWILSDKYLHRFANNKLQALGSINVTYNEADAVITGLYHASNNTLYIGTSQSFQLLQMDAVSPDTSVHEPKLKSININHQVSTPNNNNLDLSFNYNFIEFKFLPPLSSPLAKGKIYYWLNNDTMNLQPLTDSFSTKFIKLRPGNYQLFAKYINADSYESKRILIQKFSVNNPFWQQLWFIILCATAGIVLVTSLILYEQKRRFNRKLATVEMQQKIQKEKERISRDLHDNVGGQLSYVLFSLDGISEKEIEKRKEITNNVNDSIRNVIGNLRETIWAINDEHISINDFSDKFKVYARNMFRHTGTQIEFTESIEHDRKLDSLIGLNLFRICQEIINNIFKHAEANKVMVSISSTSKFAIEINDDGKGFDCNETKGGFGLQNIATRAADAGIKVKCSSKIGEGTVYTLKL